jgi:hypothetical protein
MIFIALVALIVILTATILAILHAEIFYTESFVFNFNQSCLPIVIVLASALIAIYLSYLHFG